MFNYDSYYKMYANKVLDWLPMDTKFLYSENLKNRFDELVKHGWINNNFTYKFNSLGFRCAEFVNDPTIMFLGCSYTIGIGLPIDCIYPEIVSKKLGLNCANFGIGGSSCDTAFRLCHGYIDKLKPKIVFFMRPPDIRFELVTNSSIVNLQAHNTKNTIYENLCIDDNNSYFNVQKNILAIQNICQSKKIKFVYADYNELKSESDSLARDLSHFGKESHFLFSEKIIARI